MSLCKKVGGREADTYISVAEADALLANGPDDVSDWSSLLTEQKELRLRLAAQLLGYLPLRGLRIYRGQALDFPRSGQGVSPYVIPKGVKEAQAYLAYSVVHRALANRAAPSESIGNAVRSVSLGGMLSVAFSSSTEGMGKGTVFDLITKSIAFPVYVSMKPYISQIRGRTVPDLETAPILSATTTTESSTTTSTTSSTTTTTAP